MDYEAEKKSLIAERKYCLLLDAVKGREYKPDLYSRLHFKTLEEAKLSFQKARENYYCELQISGDDGTSVFCDNYDELYYAARRKAEQNNNILIQEE